MAFEVNSQATALVTGANRGIGKAIVEGLITRGVGKVYAAVRTLSNADELVSQFGDCVVPVELDLSKPEAVVAAAKAASDVNLVINNAGVLRTSSPLSDDVEESLNYEMDVNVMGLIRVANAFSPVLKANGGGALVQLNSVASLKSFPDFATYSASQGCRVLSNSSIALNVA